MNGADWRSNERRGKKSRAPARGSPRVSQNLRPQKTLLGGVGGGGRYSSACGAAADDHAAPRRPGSVELTHADSIEAVSAADEERQQCDLS